MAPTTSSKQSEPKSTPKTNKKEEENKTAATKKDDGKDTKKPKTEAEISEEDKQFQEELDLCVTRTNDTNVEIRFNALSILKERIRTSTSSLTSVPKPLKMLRKHWQTLVDSFDRFKDDASYMSHAAWFLHAEVLSCLGMTIENDDAKFCLKYRLIAESFSGIRPTIQASIINLEEMTDEIKANVTKSEAREKACKGLGSWGNEYVKRLAYDIIGEWNDVADNENIVETDKANKRLALNNLVAEVVPFFMAFNSETDACDLLMEVEQIESMVDYTNADNVARVCLYLTSCEPYVAEGDNVKLLRTVLSIRKKLEQWVEALYIALRLNDNDEINEVFLSCKNLASQKQMSFILARQHVYLDFTENTSADDAGISSDHQEELSEIMANTHLSANFLTLATELDIREGKTPDDVYKTHLENTRPGYGPSGTQVESARMNLAQAYVNAFVNCGFGKDKLMEGDEGAKFINRNKDHGKIAAAASIGAIQLWDVDSGLTAIDKHLYAKDDEVKAGAFLGCGVVSAGIRNECDPAFALLSDYLKNKSKTLRRGAIYGLALAYAGSNREDVIESVLEFLEDEPEEASTEGAENKETMVDDSEKISKNIRKTSADILAITALSAGTIAVSTCNTTVVESILNIIKEKTLKEELHKETWYRMLAVGLALPFLCQQDAVNPTVEALKGMISDESKDVAFRDFTIVLLESLAYAATGNVLKIQKFLHICSESVEKKNEEKKEEPSATMPSSTSKSKDGSSAKTDEPKKQIYSKHQAAVLGIALIAMNEDVGSDMTMRVLGSLLRYGESVIRKTVPLAFSLLSISNPRLSVLDALSKLSHDNDVEVAQNATFAMGIVASGTNNARLAQQMRQLAQYYAKDASTLFLVKLTQGLIHMGKGTMTLQPYQGDRTLLNNVSMTGLITTLVLFGDTKNLVLSGANAHWLLYSLFLSVQPRMLLTFDENLKPLQVSVRVGQAVDVVGQAGRPKTITGFQTRTTPVLLGYGERAELATDEYLSLTPVLEGHVVLKKNPNYDATEHV